MRACRGSEGGMGIIRAQPLFHFKYHQAKDTKNLGKIFKRKMDKKACWLDDFKKQHN